MFGRKRRARLIMRMAYVIAGQYTLTRYAAASGHDPGSNFAPERCHPPGEVHQKQTRRAGRRETACFNRRTGYRQGQRAYSVVLDGGFRRSAKKQHDGHDDGAGQERPVAAERAERKAAPGRPGDARPWRSTSLKSRANYPFPSGTRSREIRLLMDGPLMLTPKTIRPKATQRPRVGHEGQNKHTCSDRKPHPPG